MYAIGTQDREMVQAGRDKNADRSMGRYYKLLLLPASVLETMATMSVTLAITKKGKGTMLHQVKIFCYMYAIRCAWLS